MISHKEIRVGNIVRMPSSNELIVITAMDIQDIQSNLKNRLPVILNQEILLKCGFVNSIENNLMSSYDLDKLSIVLPCKLYTDGRVYFNSWAILEKSMKYLHQLQNLYFALTGTELPISDLK